VLEGITSALRDDSALMEVNVQQVTTADNVFDLRVGFGGEFGVLI
jgi:hypothetical protein